MKLTRAPAWERLLVAKLSTRKAMVMPKLKLTQGRSTENTLGQRTAGAGGEREARTLPQAPQASPGSTWVLTCGGEEPPDHDEREDFSGEKEVR